MFAEKIRIRMRFALSLALLLTATGLVGSNPPEKAGEARGLSFKRYTIKEVPWSINVIRIDRGKSNFAFTTTMGDGTRQGLRPITEQLRFIPKTVGRPVAAVNGDFYQTEGDSYSGDPRGLQDREHRHLGRGRLDRRVPRRGHGLPLPRRVLARRY